MRLYIVRHGIAHDLGHHGIQRDEDRPLSPRGIARTTQGVHGFQTLGHLPTLIGSSPLVRAWQTADIFRAELELSTPIERCDFMAPGGSVTEALKWVGTRKAEAALLVGHLPDVAWLTQACLPADQRGEMHFKKAAIACIAFEHTIEVGQGRLEWFHQPRELRAKAIS